MKSRLLILGAILLAASLYPAAVKADEDRLGEFLSGVASDEGYRSGQSSSDATGSPALEGTEQKGEVETGTMPPADPEVSEPKSGFESSVMEAPVIEQGGEQYRPDIDTGP